MPQYDDVNAALDLIEQHDARSARERASRPDTINVEGRIYEVDANGEPADERQRHALTAMAQHRANETVKRGIDQHNKRADLSQRVDHRDATLNEVSAAYRQLLAEGRYRAEHGESGNQAIDLGNVVAGDLG